MEPEDGRIYVVLSDDEVIMAISEFGVESLKEIIRDIREQDSTPA